MSVLRCLVPLHLPVLLPRLSDWPSHLFEAPDARPAPSIVQEAERLRDAFTPDPSKKLGSGLPKCTNPVTLEFKDVGMTLKKGGRRILSGVTGSWKPLLHSPHRSSRSALVVLAAVRLLRLTAYCCASTGRADSFAGAVHPRPSQDTSRPPRSSL